MNGRQIIEKVYGTKNGIHCGSCKLRDYSFTFNEMKEYEIIKNRFGSIQCTQKSCLELYKFLGEEEYDKFIEWYNSRSCHSPCSIFSRGLLEEYFKNNRHKMEIL